MAGSNPHRKTGKKNRKWGRNKVKCAAYRNSNTREKNKVRRIARHLKKHPTDSVAHSGMAQLV